MSSKDKIFDLWTSLVNTGVVEMNFNIGDHHHMAPIWSSPLVTLGPIALWLRAGIGSLQLGVVHMINSLWSTYKKGKGRAQLLAAKEIAKRESNPHPQPSQITKRWRIPYDMTTQLKTQPLSWFIDSSVLIKHDSCRFVGLFAISRATIRPTKRPSFMKIWLKTSFEPT